ncbi:MAG TPA: ABC transporter permease, partial [Reyranella sp.]|nr:ABC transporter permease [Reyranella sp.]
MGSYLVRRFLLMVLTLFGMSVLIFVMLRLVPGNIADILVDAAGADPRDKIKIARELGIDRPITEQYVAWISGLSRGDLGYAYVSERPALEEIAPRIPISAKLAGMAVLFSVIIGVPFGVISAVRQNTGLDYVLRVVSLSGLSLPSFWLGLLVLMAAVHWFGTIPIYDSNSKGFWQDVAMLSLPALTVGFRSSALIMRLTRSSMLEVLRQDYVRTARSKGATNHSVNYNHALRNALLPVVTIIGIEAAFLVGGLIVTETVFNIPGV